MRKPACVGQREKAVPSGPLATPSFPARPQCAELPLAGESVSECPVVRWGPAHKSGVRLTQRACWVKVGQGQGRWEVPKAASEAGAIVRFLGLRSTFYARMGFQILLGWLEPREGLGS